jgi:N-methylhydantoinase A/oxoprolinase/acetone carboxylase beta subunit
MSPNRFHIGLDIGGTNTDAVLLNGVDVKKSIKIPTNKNNLISTITSVVHDLIGGNKWSDIDSIHLSTTLATNALAENTLERTGVLVTAGPGIDPGTFSIGRDYHVIPGGVDHRGQVVADINIAEAEGRISRLYDDGIKVFSVIGKFSPRNPLHEDRISESLKGRADFTTLGHRLSGTLNFPRRINTAYFNSSVWRISNEFAGAISTSFIDSGFTGAVRILKSDGGTMPLESIKVYPVNSILSGPAASVMGAFASVGKYGYGTESLTGDSIILDIGGTTTDISFFVKGLPVLEREGMTLQHRPTLVRSVFSRSIALGGDSEVWIAEGNLCIGPERKGLACCSGGIVPTVTDAFNVLGISPIGKVEKSIEAFESLAAALGKSRKETAGQVIAAAVGIIKNGITDALNALLDHPVYTIYEMMHPEAVRPERICLMGGPAEAFSDSLAKAMSLPAEVLQNHGVVNAVGAALAKPTIGIELFADTSLGTMRIPELGINKEISAAYSIEDAHNDASVYLKQQAASWGYPGEPDVDFHESEQFAMVGRGRRSGSNYRVRCQLRPGLLDA